MVDWCHEYSKYSNHSIWWKHTLKKWKFTAEKYFIVCALPETEDYVDLLQVDAFQIDLDKVNTGLNWVSRRKIFVPGITLHFHQWRIQECRIKIPIVSKVFISLNLNFYCPESRFKRPESSVHSLASRVQCPGSSIQSPASRVQEFRYAIFLRLAFFEKVQNVWNL